MSTAERMAKRCVHYNGTRNEACNAGHNYREIANVSELGGLGYARRLPCLGRKMGEPLGPDVDQPLQPCPSLRLPTPEELAEEERAMEEAGKRLGKALTAIHDNLKANGVRRRQDYNGKVDCPNCTGKLSYQQAGYNGHIWARCSTPGCVSFMQ